MRVFDSTGPLGTVDFCEANRDFCCEAFSFSLFVSVLIFGGGNKGIGGLLTRRTLGGGPALPGVICAPKAILSRSSSKNSSLFSY